MNRFLKRVTGAVNGCHADARAGICSSKCPNVGCYGILIK